MASSKPLNYSLKVYYECYDIIEHFMNCGYYYCVCDLYLRCQTWGDFLAVARNYCCICWVFTHYSIQDLNLIKKDFFKLPKYYCDILGDIAEVKKVNGSNDDFWDDEVEFKYRNHETGTESRSFLSDSIEFLYSL